MPSSLQEAQKFVNQFIIGEYTPEEHAAFLQWLKGASTGELAIIAERHESMEGEWVLPGGPSAAWVMQMEQKLNEAVAAREDETRRDDQELFMEDQQPVDDQQPVILIQPLRKLRWNFWTASAAVVILSVTGTYICLQKTEPKLGKIAEREKLLSMTLVNPRGGAQKEMVLADGSKVWLNAGSELKYPPRFSGSERLVELSGEAFFDVAGSADRPFRVRVKGAEVEVLGTLFTIMAYEDEPENRIAVVNGMVKVTTDGGSKEVKAGEEAEVIYALPAGIPGVRPIEYPQDILASKNGIYRFRGKELGVVMREVARAYDVNVEVQPSVANQRIDGSLDLNKSLEVTLRQLKSLTEPFQIYFDHKGKTIIASTI